MIIDFNELPVNVAANFKGGEKEYRSRRFEDERNKIMLGELEPGASIGYHSHDENSETIYLLTGKGTVLYDDSEETLLPGQAHYCPRGHSHSLINNGDTTLVFLAVVPEHKA
ncbi:MAG: cupin domain-containing protein [Muribaculaceae bacterium]|nr:cupin domain-containing protein [Muribaculaceae bacterium]MBR5117546.1 cupin domain-containing protein [Muribaculaceae bacterium]